MNEIDRIWAYAPHTLARIASKRRFQIFSYIKHISNLITPAILNGNARFVISLPPRHGKSEFLSFWLPIWFLDRFPTKKIIIASYSADLAAGFGRKIRNEMTSNDKLITKLSEDSTAAHRFNTHDGGSLITSGVEGPITGRGADLFIIDDPYRDPSQANSEKYRKTLEEWFEGVALTRLEPGGSLLNVMTRWHEDDLASYLMKKHKFDEIKLPAIAEENDCILRKPGEALCPDRYPIEALTKIRSEMDSYIWSALYQQNPIPIVGGLFKRHWWKRYSVQPSTESIFQLWDTAQKPGITNDYSVCSTWGVTQNGYYLLDVFRKKLEAPQLLESTVNQFNKWHPNAVVIEDKSSGTAVIQFLRQKTTIPVIAYNPGLRDKQIRASAATPIVESGRCHVPDEAPWLEDFLSEHEKFPNVSHDDQVDTTSMFIEYINKSKTVPSVRSL